MAERRVSVRLSVVGGNQTKAELAAVGADGQRSMERIAKATEPAGRGLRIVDAAAGQARQQIDQFASRAGAAGTVLRALGPIGIAAAAGIGAVVTTLAAGVREFEQKERAFLRLEQVLRATGNAAGMTARQIRDIASEMERTTLASDVDVMGAAGVLATFRAISGEEFRRALRAAQDLAAVFGQDIRSAATQLGKALEDPIQGLTALRRVGVSFTAAQRETINEMVRMGDIAGAQRAILETLERQVGGAGAAEAGGVTGSFHRAKAALGDFLATLAEVSGAAGITEAAMNGLAAGVNRLTGALQAMNDEGDVGQVVVRLNRQLIEAQDRLARFEETGNRRAAAIARAQIADLEARIEAVIERGREEVAAMETAEANRRAADIETRTEKGFDRLRELRKELEGLATPEERLAAINTRLAETIAQLETLRTAGNTGAIDEAVAAAQEIARRQIDAIEKPAREAAEREAAKTRELIDELTRSIAQFGNERGKFVERFVSRLGDGATAAQRAEVERLANSLYTLEQAQKKTADAEREAERLRTEAQSVYRSVRTAAEEYAETLATLNKLLAAGAISHEIYARAVARAQERLESLERTERRRLLRESGDLFGPARAFLDEYVEKAGTAAKLIEQSFSKAFSTAEEAVAQFVRTGKLEFSSLVSSMLADLARLSVRQAVLAPLANWLGNFLGGLGGGLPAFRLHEGGIAGRDGALRLAPAYTFVGAPRLHDGGVAGLRHDEVPAILQRGERVLSRREARDWDQRRMVQINIATPDLESFRRSRTQIASDIARAVAFGSRGL
jgi:lambda family phage tail tape measure protein